MAAAPEKRRAVPLAAQLETAKRQLAELMRAKGFEVERLELDHDPALGRRRVDPATGQHIPHQHDPAFLVWRPKAEHDRKTFGTPATTLGSDMHEIAKTRRLERGEEEYRTRLLAKDRGEPRQRRGTIPSRPRKPAPPQRTASRPLERRT